MNLTQLHADVVAALTPLGTVVAGLTPTAGPCYVVEAPAMVAHLRGGTPGVWEYRVQVLALPTSPSNRPELLRMADDAAAALSTLGTVTGEPAARLLGQSDIDAYTLTLEVS